MPSNSYPFIAKEGWLVLFLLASLSFVLYLNAYDIWAAVLFGLMVLGLILFRDPPRAIPPAPLGIVSPVHGTVVDIDEVDSPWLERRAKRIRIHMSIFNIYSLRGPIEGKVVDQWCKTTSHGNEKPEYAYWIQTDEKDDIVTVLSQRRPRWFYKIYYNRAIALGRDNVAGIFILVPRSMYTYRAMCAPWWNQDRRFDRVAISWLIWSIPNKSVLWMSLKRPWKKIPLRAPNQQKPEVAATILQQTNHALSTVK